MFDTIGITLLHVALACTFLASVRIAFVGLGHPPAKKWVYLLTGDGWICALIFFVPMAIGQFARRELSPLPWKAFWQGTTHHGMRDGFFLLAAVLVAELWVLWIPAHSYIVNRPDLDSRTKTLARWLNLFVGLLLLTPDNPIYKLIASLPKSSPDDF